MPGSISVVSPELQAEIKTMGKRVADLERRLSVCAEYYRSYAQDEADDPDYCVDEQHHEMAKRFRDAVGD